MFNPKIRLLILLLFILTNCKGKIIRNSHAPPRLEAPNNRATAPTWATIIQRLDHFNPVDNRTWTMRYLYSDQCFVSGGPLIIYLGGEWTISESSLMTGAAYDLACENGGYMFYTEHRYYGESYPTDDYSSENLKYLSSDQALADLAYFVQYQKENVDDLQNSNVVVIGGSYSATLATWARIKYPHLIDIAYASSAPLHAKVDFYEYYEVIYSNMEAVSSSCTSVIENAISEIETMLETTTGVSSVSTLFNTCEPLNTTEPHRAFFFNSIGEVFAGLVQYAEDGDIETACSVMENVTGSNAEKLAYYVKEYLGESNCLGSYNEFLDLYSNTSLTTNVYRQWFYQTCTEFAWYQTTTSNNQTFANTFPLDLYFNICRDLFGENYNQEIIETAVKRTNLMFGGYEPEVTRLISVHGSVDPWHPMGILEDLHPYALTHFVEGTSHCKDLRSMSESDSDQMRATKIAVRDTISMWLEELKTASSSNNIQFTYVLLIVSLLSVLYNI